MLNSKKFQDTGTSTITISAPGTGRYNRVVSLTAHSTATSTIAICSPSTTSVIWSSVVGKREVTGALVVNFPKGLGPRGTENGALKITSSAGTYRLNVTGEIDG
jgi:hypothetical protein